MSCYSMIDGYFKANLLEEKLNLYDKMKHDSICLSCHTLIGVYAKLGWFDETGKIWKDMNTYRNLIDIVTYNARLTTVESMKSITINKIRHYQM